MPVLLYPPKQRVAAALAHSLCDALVAARQVTSKVDGIGCDADDFTPSSIHRRNSRGSDTDSLSHRQEPHLQCVFYSLRDLMNTAASLPRLEPIEAQQFDAS